MASRPDLSDVLVGRFWLAHDDQHKLPGRLILAEGASPRLELDESLTPLLRELDRQEHPDGTVVHCVLADDGPDSESLVVHGKLDDGSLVTLVDAFTVEREHALLEPAGQNRQSLQARSALLGGHMATRNELYTQIRLQLRHLDAWALPGFTVGSKQVSLVGGGRLDLEQASNGGGIGGVLWLRIADLPPMTADALDRRFVTPLVTLVTLATDTDCPPVAVELAPGPDQPWLRVHHSGLRAAAEEAFPAHKQLLPLAALGLDRVGTWLGAVEPLGPFPPVVAAASVRPGRTLETQLLELATVAEGLHERRFPDSRGLPPEQAQAARQAARTAVAGLDEKVRTAIDSALKCLEYPSFPQRLEELATCIAAAMPGVTGRTNRWKRCVTDARIDFAHRRYDFLETARINELLALLGSLRWLLTGLLLLRTGLPPDELAARVEKHQPYMLFRRQAHEWLPWVFEAPAAD